MKLGEFLLHKTNTMELCAITDGGWVVATAWIDHEDLFMRYIPTNLASKPVKRDYWDYLTIVNENNTSIKIPFHFIDL